MPWLPHGDLEHDLQGLFRVKTIFFKWNPLVLISEMKRTGSFTFEYAFGTCTFPLKVELKVI